MTIQVDRDNLLTEITKDPAHGYFDKLVKNEPQIDWQGFAAKLYRISHSTSTITSYCQGICAFRDFITQTRRKTLYEIATEIKNQNNGLAYQVMDDFVTYCDNRGLMPRSTRNFFLDVKRLFAFLEIELQENKLDSIRLPSIREIEDEFPDDRTIRAIYGAATLTMRGYVQVICDTGFEPVDAAQLRVKDFKFDGDPVRINKVREKTGHKLEGFLSADTVETVKTIIRTRHKQPDDYVFVSRLSGHTVKNLRSAYNIALAKAGFGQIVKDNGGNYIGKVDRIEGHKFGKYHLKVFKKRWFSKVIAAGVPEYVAQAMLGRHGYLNQYYRQPLEKRQEFARKILKAVSVYSDKADKEQILEEAGEMLGIGKLTPEQATALKERLSLFMAASKSKIKALFED